MDSERVNGEEKENCGMKNISDWENFNEGRKETIAFKKKMLLLEEYLKDIIKEYDLFKEDAGRQVAAKTFNHKYYYFSNWKDEDGIFRLGGLSDDERKTIIKRLRKEKVEIEKYIGIDIYFDDYADMQQIIIRVGWSRNHKDLLKDLKS